MKEYLIYVGLLLNSVIILINRRKHLPDKVFIPCMILGITLMIVGMFFIKLA